MYQHLCEKSTGFAWKRQQNCKEKPTSLHRWTNSCHCRVPCAKYTLAYQNNCGAGKPKHPPTWKLARPSFRRQDPSLRLSKRAQESFSLVGKCSKMLKIALSASRSLQSALLVVYRANYGSRVRHLQIECKQYELIKFVFFY